MKRERLFTPNFTLLILGQVSSLFGNCALRFAAGMYILEFTGSAGTYSLITALSMLPTIVLSPIGGVLADRADRRAVMVALDSLSALTALLGAVWLSNGGGLAAVGTLLVLLSALSAFESPTVQACVPQMLDGDNIMRGNAVVSGVNSISSLIAPFLGAAAYSALGLRSVTAAAAGCFALTAAIECFIRLGAAPPPEKRRIAGVVRGDLAESWRFLRREQAPVLKLLLIAAGVSMILTGVMVVGYPYLVRTVLALTPGHYSVAESAAGAAAILGGLLVGVLAGRLKPSRMHRLITAAGTALLPAGLMFALPAPARAVFAVTVASFSLAQLVCSMFSICAMTEIQSRTPERLTGKVMAFVYTLSLCAQPLGQVVYGALFDAVPAAAVLTAGALAVAAAGAACGGFFRSLGRRVTDGTES